MRYLEIPSRRGVLLSPASAIVGKRALRARTIRYISRESELPLTVGTSLAFPDRMLRPGSDKAFLIQFSDEVEPLRDVTSFREKFEAEMNLSDAHGFGRSGVGRGRGQRGGPACYATVLAGAVRGAWQTTDSDGPPSDRVTPRDKEFVCKGSGSTPDRVDA
jgi:hypothetical protein